MSLQNLNLNSLLVFQKVYEMKAMTRAASHLAMTQPGVSQHISTLETNLGMKLFIRDHKKIIPTKAADEIFREISPFLESLESRLYRLSDNKSFINGEVTIGVPIEFGNNLLMPKLAMLNKAYPHIKFHIRYGLALEMNKLLASGDVDFAFIDNIQNTGGIEYIKVYEEELILCCGQKYRNSSKSVSTESTVKNKFESFQYAAYLTGEPIIREWFETCMNISKIKINVLLQTEDAQGVYSFIKENMGLGIIPRHMINHLKKEDIYIFKPKQKKLLNAVSLGYVENRIQGPFMAFMRNYLCDSFGV